MFVIIEKKQQTFTNLNIAFQGRCLFVNFVREGIVIGLENTTATYFFFKLTVSIL